MKILRFVKSNLMYLIIVTIILGLTNGYLNETSGYKILVSPILFLMIYPMMINLDITDVFKDLSEPKALIASIFINFVVSPLAAYLLSRLFFAEYPMLLIGMILIALIPTSGMTASWTGLAGGNMHAAILMISINLLLSIIVLPLYLKLFLGKIIAINTISIIKNLLKIVVIPLVLGDLTRRFIIKKYGETRFEKIKPSLGGISSIGVLLIIFVAMSLKSKTIITKPELVAYSIIPLIIYYLILILLSHYLGKISLVEKDRIALVYGTVMRNLTIALGFSLGAFGQSMAVFLISVGYIIQVPLAAVYMQFIKHKQAA